MKAIHNGIKVWLLMVVAVANISKSKNESNSQLLVDGFVLAWAVANISKSKNESNSQPKQVAGILG